MNKTTYIIIGVAVLLIGIIYFVMSSNAKAAAAAAANNNNSSGSNMGAGGGWLGLATAAISGIVTGIANKKPAATTTAAKPVNSYDQD